MRGRWQCHCIEKGHYDIKSKNDTYLLYVISNTLGLHRPTTVGGILTGGPMGPLSPFSHAHLLWARGHFKHRERRVRWAIKGHESRNVWKGRLDTYPFICQCRLWSKKHKNVNMLSKFTPHGTIKPHQQTSELNFEIISKLDGWIRPEPQTPATQTPY